jgi:hypothetical protein
VRIGRPKPFGHGSGPYSCPGGRHSLHHTPLAVFATNCSSHETARQERKYNDSDKKRGIQIHPSWLMCEVVLYVL